MSGTNPMDLCKEYIHQVWCIKGMKNVGMCAVYGFEQHRNDLHDILCDMLEIDCIKSKDILSNMDEKIDLDLSKMSFDSHFR